MQIGGSVSPKTEYVPLDLSWNDIGKDMRSTPASQVPKADLRGLDRYNNYQLEGLESDKTLMYDKIEGLKTKLMGGTNENYSKEQYNADVQRLRKLVTVGLSGLKQKEARFRDVTTAASPARGDLAINNGKAFVQDRDTLEYEVVDVSTMLNDKVDGKLRYTPQTVGTALEQRASNRSFNAFEGKGEQLEGILRSIVSSKDISDRIKKAFTGLGHVTEQEDGTRAFMGVNGNDLQEYMDAIVSGDTSKYSKQKSKHKTNEPNLRRAYETLLSSMDASGIKSGLQRNAYGEYISMFGDDPNAPDAQDWVSNRVNQTMYNHMMAYLKDEGLTSSSIGTSGSSGSTKEPTRLWDPIARTLNLAESTQQFTPSVSEEGKTIPPQSFKVVPFTDAHKIFNNIGLDTAFKSGKPESVANNSMIKEFAAGNNLSKNMFLNTDDNIPLDEVGEDKKGGIKRAMLHPESTPTMMHNVLVYKDKSTRQYGIAWDLFEKARYNDTVLVTAAAALTENPDMTTEEYNDIVNKAVFDLLESVEGRKAFGDRYDNYEFGFRNVINYDVLVPLNTEGWFGWDKDDANNYRELEQGTEAESYEDDYNLAMSGEEGKKGEGLQGGEKLHKLKVYSVAAPDDKFLTQAFQIYKKDEKDISEIKRIIKANRQQALK